MYSGCDAGVCFSPNDSHQRQVLHMQGQKVVSPASLQVTLQQVAAPDKSQTHLYNPCSKSSTHVHTVYTHATSIPSLVLEGSILSCINASEISERPLKAAVPAPQASPDNRPACTLQHMFDRTGGSKETNRAFILCDVTSVTIGLYLALVLRAVRATVAVVLR